MNIVLPVSREPLVTVYNHHAFAMSILQTNEQYMKWVCNHYIQLSYYPQYGALSFDFYMDYIYCDPVFEREFLADDMLEQAHVNIRKYIINAIKKQRYVICCVDEYYIPGTFMYQKQHFEHNIMIYGMLQNEFCVAGYNERQHFSYFTVKMKDLFHSQPHRITLLT